MKDTQLELKILDLKESRVMQEVKSKMDDYERTRLPLNTEMAGSLLDTLLMSTT